MAISLKAMVKRRMRRLSTRMEVWCHFCEVPLTATDLRAKHCTNCERPVVFKTKAALLRAISQMIE